MSLKGHLFNLNVKVEGNLCFNCPFKCNDMVNKIVNCFVGFNEVN